jgi:hypothetical protein
MGDRYLYTCQFCKEGVSFGVTAVTPVLEGKVPMGAVKATPEA